MKLCKQVLKLPWLSGLNDGICKQIYKFMTFMVTSSEHAVTEILQSSPCRNLALFCDTTCFHLHYMAADKSVLTLNIVQCGFKFWALANGCAWNHLPSLSTSIQYFDLEFYYNDSLLFKCSIQLKRQVLSLSNFWALVEAVCTLILNHLCHSFW
jgi:hypothetical protein